jgi:hypothetical protein
MVHVMELMETHKAQGDASQAKSRSTIDVDHIPNSFMENFE